MSWRKWDRQIHRRPVRPVALFLDTGLYMFGPPYAAKWRSGQP